MQEGLDKKRNDTSSFLQGVASIYMRILLEATQSNINKV
jgi:hypothetical protein